MTSLTPKKRFIYVTGSRADFFLFQSTLRAIHLSPSLDIKIIVTGSHFAPGMESSYNELLLSGIPILADVPVSVEGRDAISMIQSIATLMHSLVQLLNDCKPSALIVLGDRGEMLGAALTALHMNLPIIHLHGGERSGTIDDSIRNSISQLSQYHFVSTNLSKHRLVSMGIKPSTIFVTGAPGLDNIKEELYTDKQALFRKHGLDLKKPLAVVVYHPVVQETYNSYQSTLNLLAALGEFPELQFLILRPNYDVGSSEIARALSLPKSISFSILDHLSRKEYLSFLRFSQVLIGNSSSGIIEAASFDLPTVNIGTRQSNRERSTNVIDCSTETEDIVNSISLALLKGHQPTINVYGDGQSGDRIIHLLDNLDLAKQ